MGEHPERQLAQIYLPAVDVDDVLSTAARMYTSHRLTRIDDHTLQCATGGVTYVPIPPGATVNYAGLLSVDVPGTGRRGGTYQVVVRQVTNAFGKRVPPPPPPPGLEAEVAAVGAAAEVEWRRVLGAFQLAIPVKAKQLLLLVPEERDLSVLRWIAEAIPHHNRWHPVFHRYLEQIAGRVRTFGGDPTKILPSPTGELKPKHSREQTRALTGNIAELIFDHFGDFEGFLLETDEHEHRFSTRERNMAALAERAWHDQLRLTVIAEPQKPHTPLTIIIHQPPTPFHRHADA